MGKGATYNNLHMFTWDFFFFFFNEQIWWSGSLGKDGCKWILPENRNSSHILLFMFSGTDYHNTIHYMLYVFYVPFGLIHE